MKIIIGCQKNDLELQNAFNDYFGTDNVEMLDRKSGIGVSEVAMIVSIAQLSISIIEFLHKMLSDSTNSNSNAGNEKDDIISPTQQRRVVITKDGDINIEGYSFEEVKKLLEMIYGAEQ